MTPAFILGSGPSLDVENLDRLAGQVTIGINRIHLSGFIPSVILWHDDGVWEEHGEAMKDTGALLVGPPKYRGVANITLERTPTEEDDLNTSRMFIGGNTGTAAARWAVALGFAPVYLLGMDTGRTDTGLSHFFEGDERPDSDHARMRNELDLLLEDWGQIVRPCLSVAECDLGVSMSREQQWTEIVDRFNG